MTKIIVTGAGGFIGKALTVRLIKDGHQVLALARQDGDVTSASFWENLPDAEVLVHLAGRSYVPDSWNKPADFIMSNVISTQRALDWCRRNSARMVFASTYVYGLPDRLPIRETDPVKPSNPYALSKHIAEQCCEFSVKNHGIDVSVLRLFNVYGYGQREEFLIPTLVKQLESDQIKVMDLAPRRDYVYLTDVIDAFVRAIAGPQGFHVLNIGSGQSYSVAEIISALQMAAGTELPVVSTSEIRRQEIPDVRADIALASKVLNWKPAFSLKAGIRDMLEEANCV